MKAFLLILLSLSSLIAFEINTHHLMTQKSLEDDGIVNLNKFLKNFELEDVLYGDEKYKLENITYLQKAKKLYADVFDGTRDFDLKNKNMNYKGLLEAGSVLEDIAKINGSWTTIVSLDEMRVLRHFYDPINGSGLSIAGRRFPSSKDWGKSGNNFSWDKAIDDYKIAVSGKTYKERKKAQAHMFVSLGHVVHLVQDAHQPSHTRSDSHSDRWYLNDGRAFLEIWGQSYYQDRKTSGAGGVFNINENSFEDYFNSSAIYSNLNFYSDDSFHKPAYSLPSFSSTSESSFTSNTNGSCTPTSSDVNIKAGSTTLGYYNEALVPWAGGNRCERKYRLYGYEKTTDTDIKHKLKGNKTALISNAKALIPRAIGATKGLINHFFRGQIEIVDVTPCGIRIKNSGDAVLKSGGTFVLYADSLINGERKGISSFKLKDDLANGEEVLFPVMKKQHIEELGLSEGSEVTFVASFDGDVGAEKGFATTLKRMNISTGDFLQPTSGVLEASLQWNSPGIDLNLDVSYEGSSVGNRDIKSEFTGCPHEHWYIGSENHLVPGVYLVSVSKADVKELSESYFPENLSIEVKTPTDGVDIDLEILSAAQLNLGNVVKITVSERKTLKVEPSEDIEPTYSVHSFKVADDGFKYYYKSESLLSKLNLGPIANALFEVSELLNIYDVLYAGMTSSSQALKDNGLMLFPSSLSTILQDTKLYLISAQGGEDVDANDDFIMDSTPTQNLGSIHAILTGEEIKSGALKVSIATEIAYQLFSHSQEDNTTKINAGLDQIAQRLFKHDINSDEQIDKADLYAWLPGFDKAKLNEDYDDKIDPIVQKIYANEDIYLDVYKLIYANEVSELIYTPTLDKKLLLKLSSFVDLSQIQLDSFTLQDKDKNSVNINVQIEDDQILISPEISLKEHQTYTLAFTIEVEDNSGVKFIDKHTHSITIDDSTPLDPVPNTEIEFEVSELLNTNNVLYAGVTSYVTKSETEGVLPMPASFTQSLEDDVYYLISAKGGLDVDQYDDFMIDIFEKESLGSIHVIISGKEIKSARVKANIVTEMAYQLYTRSSLTETTQLDVALDNTAKLFFKEDVNADGFINKSDLYAWLARKDKDKLSRDYATEIVPIVSNVYEDKPVYFEIYKLFYASTLEETTVNTDLGAKKIEVQLNSFIDVNQLQIESVVLKDSALNQLEFTVNSVDNTFNIYLVEALRENEAYELSFTLNTEDSTGNSIEDKHLHTFTHNDVTAPSVLNTQVQMQNNQKYVALDVTDISLPLHYEIVGGADQDKFEIITDIFQIEKLYFKEVQSYAQSNDANADNTYELDLRIVDTASNEVIKSFSINFDESAAYEIGRYALNEATQSVLSGDEKTLYLAALDGGTHIINIQNKAEASLNTEIYGAYTHKVELSKDGQTLYTLDKYAGLKIYDLSQGNPLYKGEYSQVYVYDITLSLDEKIAYILSRDGLLIVDIEDPSSTSLIGSYPSSATKIKLSSQGDKIYLLDTITGLEIINITTPANPLLATSFTSLGGIKDLELLQESDTAYLLDSASLIHKVDISTMQVQNSYDPAMHVEDFHMSENKKFIYLIGSILKIIDINNPELPIETGSYTVIGNNMTLSTDERTAYISTGNRGLFILGLNY